MIPDLCVGEMVQVDSKKKLEVDFEHLIKDIRRAGFHVGNVSEKDLRLYASLVPKIWKADKLLESTDVRIIALSMADRDCEGLLTFERKLIESTGLRKFIENEVTFKRCYLITDDPSVGSDKGES